VSRDQCELCRISKLFRQGVSRVTLSPQIAARGAAGREWNLRPLLRGHTEHPFNGPRLVEALPQGFQPGLGPRTAQGGSAGRVPALTDPARNDQSYLRNGPCLPTPIPQGQGGRRRSEGGVECPGSGLSSPSLRAPTPGRRTNSMTRTGRRSGRLLNEGEA
jgi:hypothetical protein